MNNKFIPLDCEDDVVLLQKDTFKVSRLKQLAKEQIEKKWQHHAAYSYETQKPTTSIADFFSKISVSQETIKITEVHFNTIIDCDLLEIGSKGWQKGKLKIQISITSYKYNLCLEFCPDEPTEPESPLDDIRKMIQAT